MVHGLFGCAYLSIRGHVFIRAGREVKSDTRPSASLAVKMNFAPVIFNDLKNDAEAESVPF